MLILSLAVAVAIIVLIHEGGRRVVPAIAKLARQAPQTLSGSHIWLR